MSARPRPVTATVTKPKDYFMPLGLSEPRGTLSEGSSTASLVSVLDHDSCESPCPSDTEPDANHKHSGENKENTDTVSYSQSTTDVVSKSELLTLTEDIANTTLSRERPADGSLSPWEKWMIQKAKDLRIEHRREVRKAREKKREEEMKLQKKKEKEKKVEEQVKMWQERKELEEKLHRSAEKQRKQAESEVKEERKKQIEEKSTEKYQEWLKEKKAEELKKKEEEKSKKMEEEKKKQEHEEKCRKAFEEWKKKAKKRPRSVPNSFGYANGKLTGYYDSNSNNYPTPSFYNPIPWQPIHIPRVKSERPKSKTKPKSTYRWNPQKYL